MLEPIQTAKALEGQVKEILKAQESDRYLPIVGFSVLPRDAVMLIFQYHLLSKLLLSASTDGLGFGYNASYSGAGLKASKNFYGNILPTRSQSQRSSR